MHNIDNLDGVLSLGNRGEVGATSVAFDVTSWVALYPAGVFTITYTRGGETAVYPATGVSLVANTLTWTPSEAVLDIAGIGTVVIHCTENGVEKRSVMTKTYVAPSHAAAGVAPEPLADYIDKWGAVSLAVTGVAHTVPAAGTVAQDGTGTHFALDIPQGETGDNGIHVGTSEPTDPEKDIWVDTDAAYDFDPALWSDIDVAVTGLTNGATPTASINQNQTGTHLSLGVPKGDTGEGLRILGVVVAEINLPSVDNEIGDAYLIGSDLYLWTGAAWVNTGSVQGPSGVSAYVYIKYSADEPDADIDMIDTPSAWMGIYAGISATAPVNYTDYDWYHIEGASIVSAAMGVADIVFTKDDATTVTLAGAVAALTGPKGDTGSYTNHTHGNITNDGKVGTVADKTLMTGTDGIVVAKTTEEASAIWKFTNPNLLHNHDFRNPVNQRAVSGAITTGTYFYDRWIRNSDTVTTNADYLTIGASAEIEQRIEGNLLAGETVTVSVMVGSAVYSGTGIMPTSGTASVTLTGWGTATLGYATGYMYVRLSPTAASNVVRAKLELGTVSTLAYDAPMDHAVELPKCQRYFCTLFTIGAIYAEVALGTASSTTSADIGIILPTNMRIKPTFTQVGNLRLVNSSKNAAYAITGANANTNSTTSSIFMLTVNVASGLTVGAIYSLGADNDANARLQFSADL